MLYLLSNYITLDRAGQGSIPKLKANKKITKQMFEQNIIVALKGHNWLLIFNTKFSLF